MASGDWNRDRDRYMGGQDYEMGRQFGDRGWGAGGQEFRGRGFGGPGYGAEGFGGRGFENRGYGGPGFNAGYGGRGGGWGYGGGQEFGGRGYGPEFARGGYGGYGNEGYGPQSGMTGWGRQAFGGYGIGPGYEGQGSGGPGPGWGYGGGFGARGYEGYGDEGPIAYGGPWSNQQWTGAPPWSRQSGGQWSGQQGRGSAATMGPHAGRGPKGYQRSDQRIEEDVNEALTRNGQLDATNIQVKVDQGVVTLTGTVDSRQDKRMAEDIADSCPGVKDVHNQIRVEQGGNGQVGQTQQRQGQTQTAQAGASSSRS
jgi:BON domain-containing protein